MPQFEDYVVTVSISYEVRANGKFVCSGAAPGTGSSRSKSEAATPIKNATIHAISDGTRMVLAAVSASERAHRLARGESVGD